MSLVPGDTASILSTNTTASTAARSIYPRGPTFTLDTFASREFVVKDFVESLSDNAAPPTRRSGGHSQAFDPKPYIRAFEHALTRLGKLSEEREVHENELAGAVRKAEGQHKQHCATLQRKLDQALESFNSLDHRLESSLDGPVGQSYVAGAGGNVALQIGERLEELDRQKRQAEDARFLLQCWQGVSERGDLSMLEDTRRLGGPDGKVRCAHIAKQLLKISSRLAGEDTPVQTNGLKIAVNDLEAVNGDRNHNDTRKASETNEIIERFLESLEKDLLEQFEDCRKQHNDKGMRECATALYDFGEGASITARFVNTHEFFIDHGHMITDEVPDDRELWDQSADPDAEPPAVEPTLQSLVDEVKLVLQEEAFTIKQVFPFHEQVMVTFIQRLFAQSVQQRLELVLDKADRVSPLAFLRTLQSARNYLGPMIEELKSHGLTEHPDPALPQINQTLDQQLEDLFIPYFAGSSYIERERKSLEELYASLLFKFTLYHSQRRKAPTTYLGTISQSGRALLGKTRDSFSKRLESSDLPSAQKALLLRIAGVRSAEAKNQAEIEVTEDDGAVSLAVAKRMLKWLAEAVGRSLELSGGSETPKDVSALLKLLLTHMGDIYLDTTLDAANELAASQENAKAEPDLSFIPELRTSVNILQIVLTVVKAVLLPLAASNVTVCREMEKSVHQFTARMEDKIGLVRMRTIDVALNWVAKLLARQNRADFRPRDDAVSFEQLQTPTCSSIFSFLVRVRDLCMKAVEGKNTEAFFTELAMGFRSLLFDHFKKFQVNLAGGLMVSKDITKYIELLRSFPLAQSFQPSLEILVEVGNIFVIGPEALKDRLRGGSALTGIDKSDLRPYILRREDVGSVGVQAVLNAL